MSANPLEMPQLPGQAAPAQQNLPPQAAQLLQALLMHQQQGGQQQAPGMVSPAQVGQAPPPHPMPQPVQMAGGAAPPMAPQGGGAPAPQQMQQRPQQQPPAPAVLPGTTQGGPSSMHSPYNPAPVNRQTEFSSKGSAAQATVQNALANLSSSMQERKQEDFQKQVQQTKATMMQYLLLKQQQSPEMQQQADAMIKDPKTAKMLEKAQKDANSPQYYGVQAAYQDAMASAKNQDEMAKIQAQTEAELAKGRQEDQTAALRKKQTDQLGTVTEKDKFTEASKSERIRTQAGAVNQRTQEMAEDSKNKLKAHLKGIEMQTGAMIQATKIRTQSAEKIHATDNKVQDSLTKDYNSIANHAAKLEKEVADLQKHLDTHIWTPYTADGKATAEKIQGVTKRHEQLLKQMQEIEQKRSVMQHYQYIPPDAAEGGAPQSASGITGTGTAADPIVFSNEEMNGKQSDEPAEPAK